MRIRSDQPMDLPLREAGRPTSRTTGFDTALSAAQATSGQARSAEAASGGGAYERLIVANRGKEAPVPLAQRWGQYGAGATAAGYGEPPDPSEYGDYPVGENEPAHPLNPVGITTTDAPFTVTGYTGRGTPVPPGFYNLAYYQWYLREGGTPLEGFPGYDPADGTVQDVYGSFGDGQTRATSFNGSTTPGAGHGSHRVSGDNADTAPAAAPAELATATDLDRGDVASGGDTPATAISAEADSRATPNASTPAAPAPSATSNAKRDMPALAPARATTAPSPATSATAPAPATDDLETLTDRLLASMGDDPTARARLATNLTALLDALVRS